MTPKGCTSAAESAERIAEDAHTGQVDKAGRDYISHPRRVALAVEHLGPVAVAAAWLHDVVEDTTWTPEDLREHLPSEIVDIVALLTRQPDQHPDDYYAQVRTHPTALAVKLADIADNTDPARLDELDPALADRLRAKYAHALKALHEDPTAGRDAQGL